MSVSFFFFPNNFYLHRGLSPMLTVDCWPRQIFPWVQNERNNCGRRRRRASRYLLAKGRGIFGNFTVHPFLLTWNFVWFGIWGVCARAWNMETTVFVHLEFRHSILAKSKLRQKGYITSQPNLEILHHAMACLPSWIRKKNPIAYSCRYLYR